MRARILIGLAVGLLGAAYAPARASVWPMAGGNRAHVSHSPFLGPETNVAAWSVKLKGPARGGAAIDADGTVFVASGKGMLFAVGQNGAVRWTRKGLSAIAGVPALAGGRVHVGGGSGKLSALDARNGTVAWQYNARARITTATAVGGDGTLYFGTSAAGLIAVAPNGAERWRARVGRIGASTPAVDAAGRIFVATVDGHVVAVGADGTTIWKTAVAQRRAMLGTPVLSTSGRVYLPGRDGVIRALDADTGAVMWTFAASAPVAGLALLDDDTLAFGAGTTIEALHDDDRTASIRWSTAVAAKIRSTPVVDRAGRVFAGADDGRVYAVAADGTHWSAAIGKQVRSAAVIGLGGRVFVTAKGKPSDSLYALGEFRTGRDCWSDAFLDDAGADKDAADRAFQSLLAACGGPDVSACHAVVQGEANADRMVAGKRVMSSELSPAEYLAIARDRTRKLSSLTAGGEDALCKAASADADEDFVPDDQDACPDTPALTPTDATGCPDTTLPEAPPADLVHQFLDHFVVALDAHCGTAIPATPFPLHYGYGDCCHAWHEAITFQIEAPNDVPAGCGVWYEFESFVRSKADNSMQVFRLIVPRAAATVPNAATPDVLDFGWSWNAADPFGAFVRSSAYVNNHITFTRVRATTFGGVSSAWASFRPG